MVKLLIDLNFQGSLQYGSYIGGSFHDAASCIAIDKIGGVIYVAGTTISSNFQPATYPQINGPGIRDSFMLAFNATSGIRTISFQSFNRSCHILQSCGS